MLVITELLTIKQIINYVRKVLLKLYFIKPGIIKMLNIKICVLGMGGVGKTCIIQRFTGQEINKTHSATLGSDFSIKEHTYIKETKQIPIRFMIYDLAGQNRFKSVRTNFIDGSHAGIFVYDINNRSSFEDIPNWFMQFKNATKSTTPLVLVANKIDLRNPLNTDCITTEDGLRLVKHLETNVGYGKNNKFYFIEVSALENININAIFDSVSAQIYETYLKYIN